jgi:hypothetical protein
MPFNGRLISLLHLAPQILHAPIQTIGVKLFSPNFFLYSSVIEEVAHGCPHLYHPGTDEVARHGNSHDLRWYFP